MRSFFFRSRRSQLANAMLMIDQELEPQAPFKPAETAESDIVDFIDKQVATFAKFEEQAREAARSLLAQADTVRSDADNRIADLMALSNMKVDDLRKKARDHLALAEGFAAARQKVLDVDEAFTVGNIDTSGAKVMVAESASELREKITNAKSRRKMPDDVVEHHAV
jgi:hypothetical protein